MDSSNLKSTGSDFGNRGRVGEWGDGQQQGQRRRWQNSVKIRSFVLTATLNRILIDRSSCQKTPTRHGKQVVLFLLLVLCIGVSVGCCHRFWCCCWRSRFVCALHFLVRTTNSSLFGSRLFPVTASFFVDPKHGNDTDPSCGISEDNPCKTLTTVLNKITPPTTNSSDVPQIFLAWVPLSPAF